MFRYIIQYYRHMKLAHWEFKKARATEKVFDDLSKMSYEEFMKELNLYLPHEEHIEDYET